MKSKKTRRDILRVSRDAALGAAFVYGASVLTRSASAANEYEGIRLGHLTIPDFEFATRAAAQEFKEIYSADVVISVQPSVPLRDAFVTEVAARTGAYDVVNIAPQWVGNFGAHLEPLSPYFADAENVLPDFNLPDFDNSLVTYQENLVGLQSQADCLMLMYRTDLFESEAEKAAFKGKFGRELVVPTNWQEFEEVAEFFTRPSEGLYGHAVMGKRTPHSGQQWINRFIGLGGRYFNEKGAPDVRSEAGLQAMKLVARVVQYAPPGAMTYDFPEARQAFLNGQTAMVEAWPGSVIIFGSDPKQSKIVGKFSGAVMPNGIGSRGGWFYAISRDSQNKEAAFKWLQLLSTPKWQRVAWEKGGRLPTRISAYTQPWLIDSFPPNFDKQFVLASAKAVFPPNQFPEDTELVSELDRCVSEVMAGLRTPSEGLDDVDKSWTAILKRTGRM